MIFRKNSIVGAAVFAALSTGAVAAGEVENTPESPSWRTDEVLVTATRATDYSVATAVTTRSPVPLVEVPQSVQVLNRQLLEDQGLTNLADALMNVAGVVPAKPMEVALEQPDIRGFVAEIAIDGLPAYGATAVVDSSSLVGVEQVEVAKGPTSTLYGGGLGAPVGGLINVVTKSPTAKAARSASVRFGSRGELAPSIDINLPVADSVAVRVAAEHQQVGDYIDAVDTRRWVVHPSVVFGLGTDTELLIKGQFSHVNQLEYAGLPVEMARNPAVYSRRFSGATDAPPTTVRNNLVTAALTHRFGNGMTGAFQVRRYDSKVVENGSFVFPAFYPPLGTNYYLLTGYLPTDVSEWTADASLSGTMATGSVVHHWTAGIQADTTNYDAGLGINFFPIGIIDYAVRSSDAAFGVAPPVAQVQVDRYTTKALYAQDQMDVGDRWHVLASLRATEVGYRQIEGGTTDKTYRRLTPRVGVTYDVADGIGLFAGYARGFRATINFVGTLPPVPETSRSLEAGIKFDKPELGLSGSVAVFRMDRRNVPTADPANPFLQVQTGKQRSEGHEANLIWEPSKQWSVLASYAHTDASVREDNNPSLVGDHTARTPPDQGRLALRYRFADGQLNGLGLGFGLSAAAAAELSLPNMGPKSDGYVVADAQASYQQGRFKFGVSVTNVFDRQYLQPYQYLAMPIVAPGQPRTVQATVAIDF